jgi:carboxymethylenebutenolidase
MAMQTIDVKGQSRQGYLALPKSGSGPGILFLHAWWGLNDFFKSQCDKLADQGYVVFAPDMHLGKTAGSISEAEGLLKGVEFEDRQALVVAATEFLQNHPAVTSKKIGAIGFSMGAAYAMVLDAELPDAFAAIVLFYGGSDMDWGATHAQYQAHFAETDEYEPLEMVNKINAANVEKHIYPGTGHWFYESNWPDYYVESAAKQAWERTLQFFDKMLK